MCRNYFKYYFVFVPFSVNFRKFGLKILSLRNNCVEFYFLL